MLLNFIGESIVRECCVFWYTWAEINHDVLLLSAGVDAASNWIYLKIKNSCEPNWENQGLIIF